MPSEAATATGNLLTDMRESAKMQQQNNYSCQLNVAPITDAHQGGGGTWPGPNQPTKQNSQAVYFGSVRHRASTRLLVEYFPHKR